MAKDITIDTIKKSKPRILAVDDSRVMRKSMSKILGNNYDVVEAKDGEDAWTLLTNDQSFQVVFTDLSMPYLDGYGLLARIRESENARMREMPVIIITGQGDSDVAKQEALTKGASDFISKPFESIQLRARANAHVRHEQTTRKLSEASAKLERQATIDALSGLGGQRYFCKSAEETLSYVKRHGGQFVLLRMDIDGFDTIFIQNGKRVAAYILRTIGQMLSKTMRREDKVARIGLAKFAMMLQSTPLEEATHLAQRMQNNINELAFNIGNTTLRITTSFGLLEPKIDKKSDINKLILETEACLNKAIKTGGDQIVAKSQLENAETISD